MKKVLFVCMLAGIFILSGCSEFKKVDLKDYSINLDLRSDMQISSDGMKVQQYLKKITLNDLDLSVAGDSVKLVPNKKNRVEMETLGEIMVRIQQDGIQISNIELWMTEEQINEIN